MNKWLNNVMLDYEDFVNGKITDTEWQKFCMMHIEQLMQMNKDVLERLKNI